MQIATNAPRAAGFQRTVIQLGLALTALCVVVLVILAIVTGLPWWLGLVVGIVVGGGAALLWTTTAAAKVAKKLDLAGMAVCEDPRLVNLVEGLSLSTGTEEPTLYVLADPARNAAPVVIGDDSYIVVTSGLVESLGRMELEAVVAALLVRIKSGDAAMDTKAAGMFAYPLLDGPASALLSPVGRWALRRVIDADADIAADQSAVRITRYPPGLSSALDKISESYEPALATAGNDHLWIAPPLSTKAVVPHSPLQWRIDILLEF